MNPNSKKLARIFTNSFVLGGSPCSGKSTIASRLSSYYGLQVYKVDDHEQAHLNRIDPARHPTMYAYSTMDWNEIWSRPVPIQVQDELAFYREKSEMILQDLLEFEEGSPLILEGAAFLPELIYPWGIDKKQCVYLIPSKDFQVHHYEQRPWISQILESCDNPQVAFQNWMERDHQFGLAIIQQLTFYPYHSIIIDGNLSLDQVYDRVAAFFDLNNLELLP